MASVGRHSVRRVKKEDYARVLLTETSTYDVPVTFSNVGFYWHWKKFQEGKCLFPTVMNFLFGAESHAPYTIPLTYKIRRDGRSYRTLSLMHPAAQLRFIEFYKEFDQQFLLACSDAQFSIRFPKAVAGKYYVRNSADSRYRFRSNEVAMTVAETRDRFLTSYFSYKGYSRLHHFFDSAEFVSLERQYLVFWALDIAKCFDSIYTHSIAWATKNKVYAKETGARASFGDIFDSLMRQSNYNETAGILIGPEVSRLFAEIIFQRVDKDVQAALALDNFVEGKDYTIRRYVDDIYIFAVSDSVAEKVADVVAQCFKQFKLNLNASKTVRQVRPFISEQSRSLTAVKSALHKFTAQLFHREDGAGQTGRFTPRRIFRRRRVVSAFLNDVRAACADSVSAYEIACGYLISALVNLLRSLLSTAAAAGAAELTDRKTIDCSVVLIELIFHLYTISPSQNASVNICIAIHEVCEYFRDREGDIEEIKTLIAGAAKEFFEGAAFKKMLHDNKDCALLEALNLLAALRFLGDRFSMSVFVLEQVVNAAAQRRLSYFEVTTLLFYIADDKSQIYADIKKRIMRDIRASLNDIADIRVNAEKMYLTLDVLSCPYVQCAFREDLARRLLRTAGAAAPPQLVSRIAEAFLKYRWFTCWSKTELLAALEKKPLLKGY